jgi:hypothetical protein
MSKIKQISSSPTDYVYYFMCPGCKKWHAFSTKIHEFNYDFEEPTLFPAIVFDYPGNDTYKKSYCKSELGNGKLEFSEDSTHELAGQTVELPEIGEILDT